MIPGNLLINKPVSKDTERIAKKQFSKNDPPLFAVCGDLAINSDYGEGAVYVCRDRIVAISDSFDDGFISLDFASIAEISVKRMYGNAVLKAKNNGRVNNRPHALHLCSNGYLRCRCGFRYQGQGRRKR